MTGLVPSLLVPSLRLLSQFRHPHRLQVAQRFGPAAGEPIALPEGVTGSDVGAILDLVEALATVQDHTAVQIRVPDLSEFPIMDCRRILRAAQLLAGEPVTVSWTKQRVHLNPGTEPPSENPFTALFFESLSVTLDGQSIPLGYQQVHLPAARADLESLSKHDDHKDVNLVPAGDAPAVIRYVPELLVPPT